MRYQVGRMREVRITEAKARLAELLRDVEDGETFAITRRGRTVAHLVPPDIQGHGGDSTAVDRFLERRAKCHPLDMAIEEILEARHEGHRL